MYKAVCVQVSGVQAGMTVLGSGGGGNGLYSVRDGSEAACNRGGVTIYDR